MFQCSTVLYYECTGYVANAFGMYLVCTWTYWEDRGGLTRGVLGVAAISWGIAMPSVCTEYVLSLYQYVMIWYILYYCIVCTNAALCYTKYAHCLL
jgi:hypothetical protein